MIMYEGALVDKESKKVSVKVDSNTKLYLVENIKGNNKLISKYKEFSKDNVEKIKKKSTLFIWGEKSSNVIEAKVITITEPINGAGMDFTVVEDSNEVSGNILSIEGNEIIIEKNENIISKENKNVDMSINRGKKVKVILNEKTKIIVRHVTDSIKGIHNDTPGTKSDLKNNLSICVRGNFQNDIYEADAIVISIFN